MDQVITLNQLGEMEGLQNRDGVDLREFGKAEIERASEVQWSNEDQAWYVEFKNRTAEKLLSHTQTSKLLKNMLHEAANALKIDLNHFGELKFQDDSTILFQNYEDGVRGEIAALNYYRLTNIL